MPKLVTFLLSVFFAAAATAQTADTLVGRAYHAAGGAAWEKARYFEYTFSVYRGEERVTSFPQRWDRATGEYRVSGTDPKRNEFLAIINVNTKKGRAWLNGEEVHDSRLDDTLALALRRFDNDTFWLLMPLKLVEPKVKLEAMGERTDSCGRTWDVVKLTSEGSTHWAWIHRDTGIVEEWDMKLQGTPPDDPPVQVMLHDFTRYGTLLVSTRREVRNKNQTVKLEGLKIANETPKGAFTR
ncbi:MAG TPA: hypothetical protein VJZ76_20765 [Thermoanaerobaculia bacterium]|nr:hypothetical protein [Thermoanaerobaculia bacterium]